MADEAWEPFSRLKEAMIEANEPLGLHFMEWMILPDNRGLQAVFTIGPEAFQSPEERETDQMLDGIREATRAQELEDRSKRIVQENLKVTRKGIFPEDDTPGA